MPPIASTSTDLWAVEAKTPDGWILLPNLIFVSRESAEWEKDELSKESDDEYTGYRIAHYVKEK